MSINKTLFSLKKGMPLPLGATQQQGGINFAFFAENAQHAELVIEYKENNTIHQSKFALDPAINRCGDVWHIQIETPLSHFYYGFRVYHAENANPAVLIDPYCTKFKKRKWGEMSEYGKRPCCEFSIATVQFDWQNDASPNTPMSESVIYELHPRGFTNSPTAQVSSPGTFAGLSEKIPYLLELGITAIELLPVTAFDENDNRFRNPHTGQKLKNFWGYNPISFFAVHPGYSGADEAISEFKKMVRSMHKAGIEVLLDMVYNHSGEGDTQGTTTSFKGLANHTYYLHDHEGSYQNFSGCGNTIRCNHPIVQDLIIDSLRYWACEMHIDGFRFDLASILNRDTNGNVIQPSPIVERISQDPILKDKKLIAEAWDASGLYQVGSFTENGRWSEWNGKFRDDVRTFLAGYDNSITSLATRIAGSSDLYHPPSKSPQTSINFITSHDGFTLYDLMAYNNKINTDNGENNRDGENHNSSWDSEFEANNTQTSTPFVTEILRMRRIRTAAVILLLSQGVPMLVAGDEFGRTQRGNNNAWCQDNDLSWLDWSLAETNSDLLRFFKMCIKLRKEYSQFRRDTFFTTAHDPKAQTEISWQYLTPNEQNWAADCHALGFHLHAPENRESEGEFFIFLNGNRERSLELTLPATKKNGDWFHLINTAASTPYDIREREHSPRVSPKEIITCLPMSAKVFHCP